MKVARKLVEAARSGEIPARRLDETVTRVLAVNDRLGSLDGDPTVDSSRVAQQVGSRLALNSK